jgi:hypothetical protein
MQRAIKWNIQLTRAFAECIASPSEVESLGGATMTAIGLGYGAGPYGM